MTTRPRTATRRSGHAPDQLIRGERGLCPAGPCHRSSRLPARPTPECGLDDGGPYPSSAGVRERVTRNERTGCWRRRRGARSRPSRAAPWVRAMAQSGGDEAVAKPAYLRARPRRCASRNGTNTPPDRLESVTRHAVKATFSARWIAKRKRLIVVAASSGSFSWSPASSPCDGRALRHTHPVTRKAPASSPAGPATTPGSASTVKIAGGPARPEMSSDDFAGRCANSRKPATGTSSSSTRLNGPESSPAIPRRGKSSAPVTSCCTSSTRPSKPRPKPYSLRPPAESWQTLGQVNLALAQPARRSSRSNGRPI